MKDNLLEIIVGSLVLLFAGAFVIFSISITGYQQKGRIFNAEFGNIGGLKVGDDVMIAGVKVGEVSSNHLNNETYLAVIRLNLDKNIMVPEDSLARISTSSLLGGQYVEIIPGVSDNMLSESDTIYNTRDPVSLTDLLGKAVFSATQ